MLYGKIYQTTIHNTYSHLYARQQIIIQPIFFLLFQYRSFIDGFNLYDDDFFFYVNVFAGVCVFFVFCFVCWNACPTCHLESCSGRRRLEPLNILRAKCIWLGSIWIAVWARVCVKTIFNIFRTRHIVLRIRDSIIAETYCKCNIFFSLTLSLFSSVSWYYYFSTLSFRILLDTCISFDCASVVQHFPKKSMVLHRI